MLIKDIEREYKVKMNANSRMKLETYLTRNGLKSLAKVLKRAKNKLK